MTVIALPAMIGVYGPGRDGTWVPAGPAKASRACKELAMVGKEHWNPVGAGLHGPREAAQDRGLLAPVYEVIRQAVRDGVAEALQAAGLSQQEGHGKYYTPREAADRLRLHPYTVYELVKQGKVRAVRVGRRILIPEAAIRELGS